MKDRLLPVALAAVLGVLIIGCSGTSRAAQVENAEAAALSQPTGQALQAQDPEIVALTQLTDQATQRARSVTPDARLQQLTIMWSNGRTIYRFTNAAATEEIVVEVPSVGVASTQWPTARQTVSPLADGRPRPALNLSALQVAPAVAARALEQYWPGIRVYGLTLVNAEDGLAWYVFGDVADGVVSGRVSNATGTFEALGPGRPVRPPRTQ